MVLPHPQCQWPPSTFSAEDSAMTIGRLSQKPIVHLLSTDCLGFTICSDNSNGNQFLGRYGNRKKPRDQRLAFPFCWAILPRRQILSVKNLEEISIHRSESIDGATPQVRVAIYKGPWWFSNTTGSGDPIAIGRPFQVVKWTPKAMSQCWNRPLTPKTMWAMKKNLVVKVYRGLNSNTQSYGDYNTPWNKDPY